MDDLTSCNGLPPECPLEMPIQSLRYRTKLTRRLPSAPRGVAWRRLFIFAAAIALVCGAAHEMYLVVAVAGMTVLGAAVLALFVALFAWIALAFVSALAGFAMQFLGGENRLVPGDDGDPRGLTTRTALLMPCYNESPLRVHAGLFAIAESLTDTGAAGHFDIFILSDTTNPDIWIEEEATFLRLREQVGADMKVFYRHRPRNTGRKAGNIAEWTRRFGGAYQQMLVLDADSVMTGDAIVRLAAAMERNPDAGLIQTLPIIVNGTTLFARMQQFAGRLYGPVIAHGIAFWHGAEGNYWGHNAIIRTRAFAERAGLPELRGPRPFGGHILSHDFVEAALLRRGAWSVHMVPALRGSYEESPPSLADIAVRDRRWCQGNLQHAAVLPARGLHWVSRLHMLMGIGAYITAPMWLLFLILGVLISLQSRFITPDYFPEGHRLFPQWPIVDPVRSMWVFAGTMALLLAPKLFGFVAVLKDRRDRSGFGGPVRAFLSVLLETVLAGLLAPVTMLSQSATVVSILLGRDSGWNAQRRDDGSVATGEIVRGYAGHTMFGVVLGLIAWLVSPVLIVWMSPVVVGLVLSIPLVLLTASKTPARFLARLGLLSIPEDSDPPKALATARRLMATWAEEKIPDGLTRLVSDPSLREAHIAMLPRRRRPRTDPFDPDLLMGTARIGEALYAQEAISGLDRCETLAVMGDAAALRLLCALPLLSDDLKPVHDLTLAAVSSSFLAVSYQRTQRLTHRVFSVPAWPSPGWTGGGP
jgi:membrane glycosyltransferase